MALRKNQIWVANMGRQFDHAEIRRLKAKHPQRFAECMAIFWPIMSLLMSGEHDVVGVDDVCRETQESRILVQRRIDRMLEVGMLRRVKSNDEVFYASRIADRLLGTFRRKKAEKLKVSIVKENQSDTPLNAETSDFHQHESDPNKDHLENVSFQFSSADAAKDMPDEDNPWSKYEDVDLDAIDTEKEFREAEQRRKAENKAFDIQPSTPPKSRAQVPWSGPRGNLTADFVAQHLHRLPDLVFGQWAINSANKHGIRDQHFVAAVDVWAGKSRRFDDPKKLGKDFWGTLRNKRDGIVFDPHKHKRCG